MWRSQARKKNALASRPRPHVIHTRGLLASPLLATQLYRQAPNTPSSSLISQPASSIVRRPCGRPGREMVVVEAATVVVVVREYDGARDRRGVEAVERACEVGSSGGGKMCLFTDLLGDPLCRIRHSPASLMLVRVRITCSAA